MNVRRKLVWQHKTLTIDEAWLLEQIRKDAHIRKLEARIPKIEAKRIVARKKAAAWQHELLVQVGKEISAQKRWIDKRRRMWYARAVRRAQAVEDQKMAIEFSKMLRKEQELQAG